MQKAFIAHLAGLFVGIAAGFYYRKDFVEKKIKQKEVFIDEEKVKEWEKGFRHHKFFKHYCKTLML